MSEVQVILPLHDGPTASPEAAAANDGVISLSREIRYPPLDPEKCEIRLFDLAPGTETDDEFMGTYRVISLDQDEEDMTQYQTISYVWGETSDDSFVTVDGCAIHVTRNLQAALRRIRHATKPTTLWVDSICINQADDKEKTQQVNMMHRIYKSCTRCLIWMGEIPVNLDEETEEEAIRAAQGVFDAIRIWSDIDDEIELPETLATLEQQEAAGRALDKLMGAPWWSRIWTVQEALAPRKARILWGAHGVSWAIASRAATNVMTDYRPAWSLSWFAFFPSGDCSYFTAPIVGLRVAAAWKEENPRPIEMLWRFRYREASDPRDKVFALFGLDRDDWSFLPGITSLQYYELDVVELFKRVTIDLIKDAANNGDDRGLHALIGLRGEKKGTPGLPSWTVDWARADESVSQFWVHNNFIWQFTADRGLPRLDVDTLLSPEDDSIIRLNGVYVDEVAVCSETMAHGQQLDHTREMLMALTDRYRDYLRDSNDTSWRLEKMTDRWNYEFDKLMDMSFTGENHDPYWLGDYWPGQRIFITSKGCLGLGPSTTASGDEAWAFSGGRYPFLMRQWGESGMVGEAEHYEMVGDAFIPDIMAGQAVESRIHKQRFINVH